MARRQQAEVRAASPLPLPASKRLKTSTTTHVPAQTGLAFLVDEDARKGKKLDGKLTNGVPSTKATRVDESHAVVAQNTKHQNYVDEASDSGDEAIGSSSGEEESDSESSDDDDEDEPELPSNITKGSGSKEIPTLNGHLSDDGDDQDGSDEDAVLGAEDVDMRDRAHEDEDGEAAELEEPSFGEMLQARHPDPIDVHGSLPNPMADRQALISTSNQRTITAPSGTSLGTVLTQALKTNDKDLLESCFHTTDLPTIRSTIQRLQSQHVATLLQRLAERIYKRPGRTGSLLVWVQWSLIAHGGYLATQPDVMKKLKALSQVIRERANGLQPLLHLKGKLDMLSAQLELRRNIQAESRAAHGEDEDDEQGVVYVEGQDEEWSDSEEGDDEVVEAGARTLEPPRVKPKKQPALPNIDQSDSEDESDSDDDMPNGVIQEGNEASSDEDEDDEDEGLFDVEAEETSEDEEEGGEDEESDDEPESVSDSDEEAGISDDESDASGVKAPLPKTLNRKR